MVAKKVVDADDGLTVVVERRGGARRASDGWDFSFFFLFLSGFLCLYFFPLELEIVPADWDDESLSPCLLNGDRAILRFVYMDGAIGCLNG
ncbi:hypothetical protein F5X96DRAFT_673473 [Biscogniauxia mediterranea]|nr:hypothetical protein F5X96DRAFT_673473 [Biscogniauxia mediterranea]